MYLLNAEELKQSVSRGNEKLRGALTGWQALVQGPRSCRLLRPIADTVAAAFVLSARTSPFKVVALTDKGSGKDSSESHGSCVILMSWVYCRAESLVERGKNEVHSSFGKSFEELGPCFSIR